jgi:hypothetical protein
VHVPEGQEDRDLGGPVDGLDLDDAAVGGGEGVVDRGWLPVGVAQEPGDEGGGAEGGGGEARVSWGEVERGEGWGGDERPALT